jgi:hypothetical protein
MLALSALCRAPEVPAFDTRVLVVCNSPRFLITDR